MRNYLTLVLAFAMFNCFGSPFSGDSNVVISSASEQYRFVYEKKSKEVHIEQESEKTYYCNYFRTSISYVAFYDDKSTIDNVVIYVNGSKNKMIAPKYNYWSIQDVFYSDARICYFDLPLEKKETSSSVRLEKTNLDPRYFTTIYFSDQFSVKNKQVTITIPKWMNVELKEMNFKGCDISKKTVYNQKEDADEITYTINNLSFKDGERHSPGPSYIQPHLLVLCKYAETPNGHISYFNSLADQYAWYHSLTKELDPKDPAVVSRAQEITKGITPEIDKAKAILYWMHNNIRYVAFENGIAGFKPEKAEEVLRRKYGDCKGMANLTRSLLISSGLDGRLCWIGTNHIAYDYSTPSLAVDNHMICALILKGKTYFLDATENYLSFDEYAERIQGRQVLIEDGDKYIFTKIPPTTYAQNADNEKAILSIAGTDLTGTVSSEWKGEDKELILSLVNGTKKEKSSDAFMHYLSENNTSYQMSDFVTSDMNNLDKPLTAQYKLLHKNALSAFNNEIYVDIDFHKEFNNFIFDLKERQTDYWFSFKMNIQREVELNIPAGYVVTSIPNNLAVKSEDYEFTVVLTQKAGKIFYKKNIIIRNPHLSKLKFDQWNKDIDKLKSFYNEQILLSLKK
jgi:hypothetical protein